MNTRPFPRSRRALGNRTRALGLGSVLAVALVALALPFADAATAQAASPAAPASASASVPGLSAVSVTTFSQSGGSVAAASGDDITWAVTPATADAIDKTRNFYDYAAKRGVGLGDHVAITNYSQRSLSLHVYAADGTTDFKTGKLTLIPGTQVSKDLGSWVSVARGPSTCPSVDTGSALTKCLAGLGIQLTVQPNTSVIVPFRIQIPKNASAGDHVAGIVAAYTVAGAGKHAISVEERVGARIYLRVAGKLHPKLGTNGAVASFHAPSNPFGTGSETIGFDLKDTGNTRMSALPTITVTGIFGIPAGSAKARPVQNLLPGGVAHVEATVTNVPQIFLLFGGITVTPEHADGNIGADALAVATQSTVVTWAVPWIWVLIVLVAAALAVGVVWWRRRANANFAGALRDYALQLQADARGGDSETTR